MSKIQQPKVSMHAVHTLPDPGASQGARRATEDAPGSAVPAVQLDAEENQNPDEIDRQQGEEEERQDAHPHSAAGQVREERGEPETHVERVLPLGHPGDRGDLDRMKRPQGCNAETRCGRQAASDTA